MTNTKSLSRLLTVGLISAFAAAMLYVAMLPPVALFG